MIDSNSSSVKDYRPEQFIGLVGAIGANLRLSSRFIAALTERVRIPIAGYYAQ